MASGKTEEEIEVQALRAHRILCDEKKPTPSEINSLYQGFSEQDKSRVESRLMQMFYHDLKSVERSINSAENPTVMKELENALKVAMNNFEVAQKSETRAEVKGTLKEIGRMLQKAKVFVNTPITLSGNGKGHAEEIYRLIANADGHWEKNKAEIQKIVDKLSNKERWDVNDRVFALVFKTKQPEIAEKYSEVAKLVIAANDKAMQAIVKSAHSDLQALQNNASNPDHTRNLQKTSRPQKHSLR